MKEANREVLDAGSLPSLLADRARRVSDRRLAIEAGVGILTATAGVLLRFPLWLPVTSFACCLALFGAWGILEREAADLDPGSRHARTARAAQHGLVALGAAAATIGVVSFFAIVIGRQIS